MSPTSGHHTYRKRTSEFLPPLLLARVPRERQHYRVLRRLDLGRHASPSRWPAACHARTRLLRPPRLLRVGLGLLRRLALLLGRQQLGVLAQHKVIGGLQGDGRGSILSVPFDVVRHLVPDGF